ncbi:MAG: hypothetical protein HKP58_17205 [Desulfatitalea sp.]|nr:hypothetical protein [Desulfatitalea sp.]NNK02153.1 hypothetical protein [Desulfatitalea sp.]
MKQGYKLILLLLLAASFILTGCRTAKQEDAEHDEGPAQMKALPFDGAFNPEGGRAAKGITLTALAAQRIGIKTGKINEIRNGNGPTRKAVPYAAVLYDPHGKTWVYTIRQPLTYLREPVAVEVIEDEVAILSNGPEAGTTIAAVGIAMLYGVEHGIGQ